MRRLLLFSAVMLIAAFVLGSSGPVQSQDTGDVPPQVIDIWPLPGVELSPDEPLTVTFNQPMNQTSVEAAFSTEPGLEPTFSWSDDRTLNLVPADGWPRSTEYTITINTDAQSADGLALPDPVMFDVKTIGPLEVSAVVPDVDADGVAADARLVVTFNRPVVPLVSTEELDTLPQPVSIEPTVAGKGEWLNTSIYMFTPSEALRGGTQYTVTVGAGLTAVDGAELGTDYVWSFRTLPPQVLNIWPRNGQDDVLLDRQVSVTFSQPMNKPSTEEAFRLQGGGQGVAGTFQWDDEATVMTFVPDEMLQIETSYSINVAPTAQSAGGDATLDQGYSYSFETVPYPGVSSTSPRNGDTDVRPGGGATIYFKSPMNADTLEGKIRVEPNIEWQPRIWNNESVTVEFRSSPQTRYTITLLAGAEDIYGNPILSDYTFRYTTREIDTWAYPIIQYNDSLQITGAHRMNTRISMMISGAPKVNFRLYDINQDDLPEAMDQAIRRGSYYYSEEMPPWARNDNLRRAWAENMNSDGREGVPAEVLLASEDGGTLPNGVYWLVIQSPNRWNDDDDIYQFPLVVATANLTVKRAPDETLVWVTDMPNADPITNATVTIYHNNEAIARGQTDSEGVLRAPVDLSSNDEFIFIEVEGEDAYGVWYSYGDSDLPTERHYLYTDRPIYRPGETVYFRGALRDRVDMTYSVPNQRSTLVQVYATDGTTLFDESVSVTDFGTFSGEFDLPEEVALGDANMYVDGSYLYFQIAEFRVPEFEVSVTAQQDEILQGTTLNAVAQASYYFGGGVSNAEVYWSAYGSPASFNYTGPGRYSFYDESWDYFYNQYLGDGNGTTDSSGQFVIEVENTTAPVGRPMNIVVESTVTDESYQAISGRTSILAHPANVYVGLRSDRYFGRANEPMNINLVAVDSESVPLTNKEVTLQFVEIRWSRNPVDGQFGRYTWSQEEIEVETVTVRTDDTGRYTYEFTPPNAGIFRVRASAIDEYERTNSSTLRFWVMGNRPVWWGEPSETIDLIVDQDTYKPGDVAQILVPIPFAGESTVLVSVERAGIIEYEVIEMEGSTLLYELPITEDHVPTVHFSVTLVKGIDEESLNPDFRTGQIALSVEPVKQRLNVTVTPSADFTQPGDPLTFDIEITDSEGNPVQAEIGLTLTDKAILSLSAPNSSSLEAAYYGHQSNYVQTGVSINALLDRITDTTVGVSEDELMRDTGMDAFADDGAVMEAGAPMPTADAAAAPGEARGEGQQPVAVREDFQQTPLWEAHVVTDADGRATVTLEALPDNLTTWALDARALTITTEVGQAETEVVTTLPLLVRPVTPRFMVVGDRVELATVINNNSPDEQTVQATLQAEGVALEDDVTQTVTIPAGSRARVEWMAVVEDVPYADLTFIATGADGYQDASRPTLATGPDGTIPVYRYTAPDHVGTGGLLREAGARVEGISLPPRLDTSQGELIIHADPSLAVTTIDTFDYLKDYPHLCIEQHVSRFLPNMMTYRALRDLGISDPELEADLFNVLEMVLDILEREQNADGGWGWFVGMESNPYVTAYAALGLIEARDAGFAVNQEMIDRALDFVRTQIIRPNIDTSHWRLNRQAFYFYVLARDGRGNESEYNQLYGLRLNMSLQGRAYLLMAYHEKFPNNAAITDLVSDLNTAAIVSATGTHWEEDRLDWWNWTSNTRTTALILNALVRVEPDNELLPGAVRWLMVARRGDHWETTQETAWAVMALTDWMVSTGELQGNYEYNVALNRDGLANVTVTPDTVREGQELRIAVGDLLTDELNRLVFARGEGQGVLYYTAHLDLRLDASEVGAINRGISVQREYFLDGDPDTPITSANVGDIINVRLTLTLPQDIYFFVLEDPIPAGTEAVDTSLLTTSTQASGPNLQPQNGLPWWWFWGWWWFDRTELRDEQANLYADFLPDGTYVYTYQIRASVPGEFQTMPSEAYAFYFPEVFGRTAGELFTITE